MPRRRARRKMTYYPQAILVVLPLAMLVLVGIWSLRQDRLLAEQDARDRARHVAGQLLPEFLEGLAFFEGPDIDTLEEPSADTVSFVVTGAGDLLKPQPLGQPSPNPLEPGHLDPDVASVWQQARDAEFRDGAADSALSAYRRFLECSVPDDFAAVAGISVALLESRRNRPREAVDQLWAVLDLPLETVIESGLPAHAVAAIQLIELNHQNEVSLPVELVEGVCSNAVERPTWITGPLLERIAESTDEVQRFIGLRWRAAWQRDETARRLHQAMRPYLHPGLPATRTGLMSDPQFAELIRDPPDRSGPDGPRALWFASNGSSWLGIFHPAAERRIVLCIPGRTVGSRLDGVLRDVDNIAPYFGVAITLGSRQYHVGSSSADEPCDWQPVTGRPAALLSSPSVQLGTASGTAIIAAPVLASESTVHPLLGRVDVDVYLRNPSLLYARQRARTYWFGGVIVVSAAAALIGLATGWRAFHRQQRLVEMQSNFVSSVSHELRAPIASIRLLAESLEDGRVRSPDKQAEYFSLMGHECRRLTSLIGNVLDFSRIDQGRKQYEFEPTDAAALVRQTVRLMEPQAAERQVALVVRLPSLPDAGLRPLDGRAIQQALVNLIDNAIKHAPPNSTVEIALAVDPPAQPAVSHPTEASPSANVGLCIRVTDTGEGIPVAEQSRIFEPFYRRGTELRRETAGIGIGLSIVQHIAEAHGGRVTVDSVPGKGSTFTLQLP